MRIALLGVVLATPAVASADEGLWPFNLPPAAEVKARHGFTMDRAFLDRTMRASARIDKASGAFVSPSGLLITNHHVVSECVHHLSTGGRDLMRDGFLAASPAEEAKCPGLAVDVLLEIGDVTREVENAARDAPGDAEKNAARKAEMAKLEKACGTCEVVTLYAGAAYHLYRYARYTDVRLVFAPEWDVAYFGGDPDNFNYPRYCFDVAFLRAYDGDRPAKTPDFFRVARRGPTDGELVFISGNPGTTDRYSAVSRFRLLRDVSYPFLIARFEERRDVLRAYGAKGEAQARAVREELLTADNALKALGGYLRGLRDTSLMSAATAREKAMLAKLAELDDAKLRARAAAAFPALAAAHAEHGKIYAEQQVLEGPYGAQGQLFGFARHILRARAERARPDAERLHEYRDSNLAAIERAVTAEVAIDRGVEVERLTLGLETLVEVLGKGHAAVKRALAGKTPRARAEALVAATKLHDTAVRRALYTGDGDDAMLELARALDGGARAIRKRHEERVESVERAHAGVVAEAWARAYGNTVYPDATNTLRINAGVVRGYTEAGKALAFTTKLGGLFERHEKAGGKAPYALPRRWLEARARLDAETPFNFVSTNDLIGGSSGSPAFDRKGELVGVIFDINYANLANRFFYRPDPARGISASSALILHALTEVYGAKALIAELSP